MQITRLVDAHILNRAHGMALGTPNILLSNPLLVNTLDVVSR